MKIESVLFKLREAARVSEDDMELGHLMADGALLEYINNPRIEAAYDEVVKNYERRLESDGGAAQTDSGCPGEVGGQGNPGVVGRAEAGGELK